MKNLIIGFMLGMWCGPIIKDVTRRVVEKQQAAREETVS